MPKPPLTHPDPLVMKVRKILQSIEPRKLPEETITNEYGHTGWKCPYCGSYVPRKDRQRYTRNGYQTTVDYAHYNQHFAHSHGKPFWKEEQVVKLLRRELAKPGV